MASRQVKINVSVFSVFLGVVLLVVGIGFVEWRPTDDLNDGQSIELDEETYLELEEKERSKPDERERDDEGRLSIFDPPGYELRTIKKKLPWTWDTCGLRNTSEEMGRAEQQDEGRVWEGNSYPVKRGQFPWFLIIFGGERDEKMKENNGWVSHGGGGCGASLISGHHGLTAAHCYCTEMRNQPKEPNKKRKIYVAAGLKNTFEVTEPAFAGSWRLITDCQELRYGVDIGVMTWAGPAYQFTKNANGIIVINSVCLNLPTAIYYGTRMEFTGNGYNDGYWRWFPWTYTFWLYCHGSSTWPKSFELRYCRLNPVREGAVCSGDSGGPMISALHPREPNRWYQTGVSGAIVLAKGNVFDDCNNGLAYLFFRPDAVVDLINGKVHD